MMTRKNYLAAAEIVRGLARDAANETASLRHEAEAERDGALEAFITFFSQDNPAFDRARFREACEYKAPAKVETFPGVAGGGIVETKLPRRKSRSAPVDHHAIALNDPNLRRRGKGTTRFVGVKTP